MLVAGALLGVENEILVVWVWFGSDWALYSPVLPAFQRFNFLLRPGSIVFVVEA